MTSADITVVHTVEQGIVSLRVTAWDNITRRVVTQTIDLEKRQAEQLSRMLVEPPKNVDIFV